MNSSIIRMFLVATFVLFASPAISGVFGIQSFSPQGEVKDIRQVRVEFSEQMVPFGDTNQTKQPFTINCAMKGKGRWVDEFNWVYNFESDFPAGVQCIFTMKKSVKSYNGSRLKGTKKYRFSSGGVSIIKSYPYRQIVEDAAIILTLNAKVNEKSVENHAYFRTSGQKNRFGLKIIDKKYRRLILNQHFKKSVTETGRNGVEGVTEGVTEMDWGRVVVVRSAVRLPANENIELVWAKGIKTLGGHARSKDQIRRYRTRPEFSAKFGCQHLRKGLDCNPARGMRLSFTAPVAKKYATEVLIKDATGRVFKPSSGNDIVVERELISSVQFDGPFPEKSELTLFVPSGVVDETGRKLVNQKSFPLKIKTSVFPPTLSFPSKFVVLDSESDPTLVLTAKNVEKTLPLRIYSPLKQRGLSGALKSLFGALKKGVLQQPSRNLHSIMAWMHRLKVSKSSESIFAARKTDAFPGVAVFDSKLHPFEEKKLDLPKVTDDDSGVLGIPMKKPGLYIIETESSILASLTSKKKKTHYERTSVLVTNLGLHFKRGDENSLIFVTNLTTGKPIPGARVSLRDCKGELHYSGVTNKNGTSLVKKSLPDENSLPKCSEKEYSIYRSGLLITAEKGRDLSFIHSGWNSGIEGWRFGLTHSYDVDDNIAETIFDRTLFKTGETVHMKHLVRKRVLSGFSHLEDKELPNMVRIRHSGTGESNYLPVKWDMNGFAVSKYWLSKNTKLGFYQVSLVRTIPPKNGDKKSNSPKVLRSYHAGSFRVEEFRIPKTTGSITPPKEDLVNPKEVSYNVSVQYLSGGVAGELPIKIRSKLETTTTGFEGFEDYLFATGPIGQKPGKSSKMKTRKSNLEEGGSARITLKMPKIALPMNHSTELEYMDPNGEIQTISNTTKIWSSSQLIGIRPDAWVLSKNKLNVDIAVVDTKGTPVEGVPLIVNIYKKKYRTKKTPIIGGFYFYEKDHSINKVGVLCEGVTDNTGILSCKGKSKEHGLLLIEAKSKRSSAPVLSANYEMWVSETEGGWVLPTDSNRMELIPQKKQYAPGEKAKFLVKTPFKESYALVTVEREGIAKSFVTKLKGDKPFVTIPVEGNHAPNMFVSVLAVRGRIGERKSLSKIDMNAPTYRLGIAEIKVKHDAFALDVNVKSSGKTFKVRSKVRADIEVKSLDGRPLIRGAEIAVAVVDEGLLELKSNESFNLLASMMRHRGHGVADLSIFSSPADIGYMLKGFGAQRSAMDSEMSVGESAPASGGADQKAQGSKEARALFNSLVFWKDRVSLKDGKASVEFELNDSLTSFRIVAVASSGVGKFGTGQTTIKTMQDISIVPGLPKTVREGDRFRAFVTVRNMSPRKKPITVELKADMLPKKMKPIVVEVESGASKVVSWYIEVPNDITKIAYELFAFVGGEVEDRVQIIQEVFPAVPVRTYQAKLIQIDGKYRSAIKMPRAAIGGRGGLHLSMSSTMLDAMTPLREHMLRTSYSCIEYQASKSVVLNDQNIWQEVVKNLEKYLDPDGLVKYFPSSKSGSSTLTSYILLLSHESGFKIPDKTQKKMIKALKRFVNGEIKRDSMMRADLTPRKLSAIEALSRFKKADKKMISQITIAPNMWPTSAVIDWLNILQRTKFGGKNAFEKAEQILKSRLTFSGTQMGFSTEKKDWLWWLMVSTDRNALRLLLSLLEFNIWERDMPKILNSVVARQKGKGHWDISTANAIGILALKRFAEKYEKEQVWGSTLASFAGKNSSLDWQKNTSGGVLSLPWAKKNGVLNIVHKGKGKPWTTVESRVALPLKKSIKSGYSIEKKVFPVQRKRKNKWSVGDVLRVKLEIVAQSDMGWVVSYDPIPAGATILGSGLKRDSKLLGREKSRGWVYPVHKERTSRAYVAYYRYIPKGKWTIEYTYRVNNSGSFQLPPTRIQAMYAPDVYGENPNKRMTILR